MNRSIRAVPHFHLHVPSATSAAHAIVLASLCAFIVTAFLLDLHRGASRRDQAPSVEPHR